MSLERFEDALSKRSFFYEINVNEERNTVDRSSTHMDGRFHHFQLTIDMILEKEPAPSDRQHFFEICRKEYENDQTKLAAIELFENSYSPDDALRWYTKPSFLPTLLNKALRTRNIHFLKLYGFFIRDIHAQLAKLQAEQPRMAIQVHRGQLMSSEEVALLMSVEGQLISINSFLSTTPDVAVALAFLGEGALDEGIHRVLLTLNIDPNTPKTKPFANIRSKSVIPDEDEVLIMLGNVFHIDEVRLLNDVWHIHMTLCECRKLDNEQLALRWRECLDKNSILQANALTNAKRVALPEPCFRRFLHTASSTSDFELDEYDDNVEIYQQLLDIFDQILSPTHPNIVDCHNHMGRIYSSRNDFTSALVSFEKALHLLQAAESEDNEKIVLCLHNIAHQHMQQKSFEKALPYEQQALDIMMAIAPTNHQDLLTAHMNIVDIYTALQNFDAALNHLDHASQISVHASPRDRIDISQMYLNMAAIYTSKGDYLQVGILLDKAFEIGTAEGLNLLPFVGEVGKFIHDLSSQH